MSMKSFSSPDVLEMETFADQLPNISSGQCRVIRKPGNAKCWTESSDDLETMYALAILDDRYNQTLKCGDFIDL